MWYTTIMIEQGTNREASSHTEHLNPGIKVLLLSPENVLYDPESATPGTIWLTKPIDEATTTLGGSEWVLKAREVNGIGKKMELGGIYQLPYTQDTKYGGPAPLGILAWKYGIAGHKSIPVNQPDGIPYDQWKFFVDAYERFLAPYTREEAVQKFNPYNRQMYIPIKNNHLHIRIPEYDIPPLPVLLAGFNLLDAATNQVIQPNLVRTWHITNGGNYESIISFVRTDVYRCTKSMN